MLYLSIIFLRFFFCKFISGIWTFLWITSHCHDIYSPIAISSKAVSEFYIVQILFCLSFVCSIFLPSKKLRFPEQIACMFATLDLLLDSLSFNSATSFLTVQFQRNMCNCSIVVNLNYF